MAYKDPERAKAYSSNHGKRIRRERRAIAISFLGGKCVKCGSIKDLECDHINPATKSFDISHGWFYALNLFMAELQKCQLLCKPCHLAKSAIDNQSEIIHGTNSGYIRGCRCQSCKDSHAEYNLDWSAKNALSDPLAREKRSEYNRNYYRKNKRKLDTPKT
jgi:hypothetical protein